MFSCHRQSGEQAFAHWAQSFAETFILCTKDSLVAQRELNPCEALCAVCNRPCSIEHFEHRKWTTKGSQEGCPACLLASTREVEEHNLQLAEADSKQGKNCIKTHKRFSGRPCSKPAG